MKIACSSASFSARLDAGALTQLEWLDLCANELEVDGVVFDARHFPRRDGDYLAQLKKTAADLGLTVAALECERLSGTSDDAGWLQTAADLGAPLLVTGAPSASDDPDAWGRFADAAKQAASAAKRRNVTLALRNAAGTLCTDAADLRHIAKDVDSAWLRFAPNASVFSESESLAGIIEKTLLAIHVMSDTHGFAQNGDREAAQLIERLRRFRGFVVLERPASDAADDAFHAAIARFLALRSRALYEPGSGNEALLGGAMDAITAIRTRRSVGRPLGDVPPATVEGLIELATCAPNHHLTEPWRFTIVAGEERDQLGRLWGSLWAQSQGLEGDARRESIARDQAKLARAPQQVIVSTRTDDDPVVAEEDFAATAAAVQNFLLAAHARNLAAMWRTGPMIHDPAIKAFLGLNPRDRIVATIYLGSSAAAQAPPRPRRNQSITHWLKAPLSTQTERKHE